MNEEKSRALPVGQPPEARDPRAPVVPGHVIRMTLDHTKTPSDRVATCECGKFTLCAKWPPDERLRKRMDARIEAHWREVAPR